MDKADNIKFCAGSPPPLPYHDLCDSALLDQAYSIVHDDHNNGSEVFLLKNIDGHFFNDHTLEKEAGVSGANPNVEYHVLVAEHAQNGGNDVDYAETACAVQQEIHPRKQYHKEGQSRQERRREQNRRAAHRCRIKRKMREAAVMQELEQELVKARCLEAEIQRLTSQKQELEQTLLQHGMLEPPGACYSVNTAQARDVMPALPVSHSHPGFFPLHSEDGSVDHFC